LKTLGANSNIEKLASQIVSKCSSIISEERLPEVMTAISDLRMAVMANSAPPAEASEGKDASDSKAAEPPARAPPRHPRSLAPVDDVSDPATGASSKQRPGREGGSSRPSRSSSRSVASGRRQLRSAATSSYSFSECVTSSGDAAGPFVLRAAYGLLRVVHKASPVSGKAGGARS